MTIDTRIADLINADIDRDITADDRVELDACLAANDEAKAYHAEMAGLCTELDAVEAVEPPPHLKHVILNAVPRPRQSGTSNGISSLFGGLSALFGASSLRYAMSFAVGAILAISLIGTGPASMQAPGDVGAMVGTIRQPDQATYGTIDLNLRDIRGSVALIADGNQMSLEFDLESNGPVEVVASFADDNLGFSGFAQTVHSDATIISEAGTVIVSTNGRQRYSVYLQQNGTATANIELQFYANSTLVHEARLSR